MAEGLGVGGAGGDGGEGGEGGEGGDGEGPPVDGGMGSRIENFRDLFNKVLGFWEVG